MNTKKADIKKANDDRYSAWALTLALVIATFTIAGRIADVFWMKILGYCLSAVLATSIWWFAFRPKSIELTYKKLRRKAIAGKYIYLATVLSGTALVLLIAVKPESGLPNVVRWLLAVFCLIASYWLTYQYNQKRNTSPR